MTLILSGVNMMRFIKYVSIILIISLIIGISGCAGRDLSHNEDDAYLLTNVTLETLKTDPALELVEYDVDPENNGVTKVLLRFKINKEHLNGSEDLNRLVIIEPSRSIKITDIDLNLGGRIADYEEEDGGYSEVKIKINLSKPELLMLIDLVDEEGNSLERSSRKGEFDLLKIETITENGFGSYVLEVEYS